MTTISCHHARAALVKAVNQGHNRENLLIQAGINPLLLQRPNSRVSENQMTKLVQLIWEALDDEFMGFTQTPCKRGAFALMAQSIRHCDNLREALKMGMRFYNLFTDDIHTALIETDNNEAIIEIVFSRPELDPEYFYLEFWMVIWHRLASWMTGTRILLLETSLSHPPPAHANELQHMFPSIHQFNAPTNQLKFSAEYLNLPLIRDKKAMNEFLKRSPYNLLSIPGNDQSLQSKISRIIVQLSDDKLYFPPIKEMASQLNLSPQTLHRRLKSEASSYQRIKDNMKRDIAVVKLIQEKLPVHKVAEIVGFSDSRSFSRAFKQWTGSSPREYCKFI